MMRATPGDGWDVDDEVGTTHTPFSSTGDSGLEDGRQRGDVLLEDVPSVEAAVDVLDDQGNVAYEVARAGRARPGSDWGPQRVRLARLAGDVVAVSSWRLTAPMNLSRSS